MNQKISYGKRQEDMRFDNFVYIYNRILLKTIKPSVLNYICVAMVDITLFVSYYI